MPRRCTSRSPEAGNSSLASADLGDLNFFSKKTARLTPRGFLFFNMTPVNRFKKGFSLIEILMVMIIVAILSTMVFPLYSALRQKAGLAGCLSNLRIIGIGLNTYLQDHNMVWPQLPKGVDGKPDYFGGDPVQLANWWKDTLTPYDVATKHWICPSDKARLEDQTVRQRFTASYGATFFDEYPNTAFKWKQPWAKENSGMHGMRGPNMLMPDGTIIEGIPTLSEALNRR